MTTKEYNNGVRLWSDEVYRFAVHCGFDKELAKDATQESFATLWEQRKDVAVDKGKSFLLSVVHHKIASHFRHGQVHQHAVAQLRVCSSVAPDENFDLQAALRKSMQKLPEVQRSAIELKDVQGYSNSEIANILSISENQVGVYLFRARVSLKKSLIALGYDYNNQ